MPRPLVAVDDMRVPLLREEESQSLVDAGRSSSTGTQVHLPGSGSSRSSNWSLVEAPSLLHASRPHNQAGVGRRSSPSSRQFFCACCYSRSSRRDDSGSRRRRDADEVHPATENDIGVIEDEDAEDSMNCCCDPCGVCSGGRSGKRKSSGCLGDLRSVCSCCNGTGSVLIFAAIAAGVALLLRSKEPIGPENSKVWLSARRSLLDLSRILYLFPRHFFPSYA